LQIGHIKNVYKRETIIDVAFHLHLTYSTQNVWKCYCELFQYICTKNERNFVVTRNHLSIIKLRWDKSDFASPRLRTRCSFSNSLCHMTDQAIHLAFVRSRSSSEHKSKIGCSSLPILDKLDLFSNSDKVGKRHVSWCYRENVMF